MTTTPTYQYTYLLNYGPPHMGDAVAQVHNDPSFFIFSGTTATTGETITFFYNNIRQNGSNTYTGYTDTTRLTPWSTT